MPGFITPNATLYHRKCYISFSEMPHFALAEFRTFALLFLQVIYFIDLVNLQ